MRITDQESPTSNKRSSEKKRRQHRKRKSLLDTKKFDQDEMVDF